MFLSEILEKVLEIVFLMSIAYMQCILAVLPDKKIIFAFLKSKITGKNFSMG